MRQKLIEWVKEGDVLGTTILSQQGRVLLNRGVILTDKMITRLREHGITMIMIDDAISKDVIMEDIVTFERRREAMVTLEASGEAFNTGRGLDTFRLKEVVKDIVDEIIFKKHILSGVIDIRSNDTQIFAHSVNVCILSVVLGKALGLDRDNLDTLAVGAILHDIGAINLPQSLLHKREPFTPAELTLYKTHAEKGYEILRTRRDISFVSAHIAYQHHEALDGSGYPRGLDDKKFHPLAQIVALADYYDSLVNEGPGHGRIHPDEAVETLTAGAEVLFSYELLKTFLKHIAVYPNGCTVELNSGDIGIVIRQNQSFPTRPVVRILPGSSVNSDKTINMVEHLTLFIIKVVEKNTVKDPLENIQAQIDKSELQKKVTQDDGKRADTTANANETQSLFLADLSKQQLAKGNRMMAIMLALEALPKDSDNPDRPFVIEAETALRNAITENNVEGYISNNILKHDEGIVSIAFSHDGSKVVTASDDYTAIIWDTASGKELNKLRHNARVNIAKFSPNDCKVVTASDDHTAIIWNVATGKVLATLKGHIRAVYNAEFNADGSKVVTASDDNSAIVWDVPTGKVLAKLKGFSVLEISPDDSKVVMIVSGDNDNTAIIWDVATNKELAKLEGHTLAVCTAKFSPDGSMVITSSFDQTVIIWDVPTGKELASLEGLSGYVATTEFSPDGSKVVTTSYNNTAIIWDAATGKELVKLEGHTSPVQTAEFSPDSSKVITASDDHTAIIWDVVTGKELATLEKHSDVVNTAEFNPEGSKVITASNDHTAIIWPIKTLNEVIEEAQQCLNGRELTYDEKQEFFLN
ncbi:MAG: HD domain-containing phosphohydrolase [Desulfitobacteriaceae bacterium]